ncbi:MAG: hypothetical protein RSC06_13965 [Clostridia bacterium]
MIQISEKAARCLVWALDDITDIQARAGCSDAYYRKHFRLVVEQSPLVEAKAEIEAALNSLDRQVAAQDGDLVLSPAGAPSGNPRDPSISGKEDHHEV